MADTISIEAWNELKEVISKGKTESAESKEKIAKLETVLDKQEEKNQELVEKQLDFKSQNEKLVEDIKGLETEVKKGFSDSDDYKSLKDQIKSLETTLSRPDFGKGGKQVSEEMKAFEKMVVKGKESLSAIELKYLRTDSGAEGQFLNLPPEMADSIIKKITELSPMRQICRVKKTNSKSYIQPVRITNVTSTSAGEGQLVGESNSRYGEVEITPHKLVAVVAITHEMLQDSAFDMEVEIMEDVNEEFARSEGNQAINGFASLNQMNGFLNNTDIQIVPATGGGVGNFASDDLITLTGALKRGYDPLFIFNRTTLAKIRKFKGSDGHPIWAPNLAVGEPATINGDPYRLMEDMPLLASGSKSVSYGDWRRGYCIVDRMGISFIRDQFTLSDQGKVRFVITMRVGGDVILPEAIKVLTSTV